MSDKIIVIGGGVSGYTTALTLELLGFDTQIIAAETPSQIADKSSHPEFASLFPSASIIPHSVYSDQLEELFQLSQSTFYELRKQVFPGLTTHKHFEIFETDPGQPDYCNWMLNFREIGDLDPDTIPRRQNSPKLHGWVFDCIFADWSLYFPALRALYRQCGGETTNRKLNRKEIVELPAEIVINCSGTGAPDLFDDPVDEQLLLRGHLLHKAEAPLITNAGNEIISYNYIPEASVYSDTSGEACDVYCYPRKDGWILGGSRQAGNLKTQNWDEFTSSTDKLNGIRFPSQIIDLNNEILEHTYGMSVDRSDPLSATVGYRYIRSRKDGLRLEKEPSGSKIVYHNYGHGGAGVTLSWGCALDIAKEMTSREVPALQSELLDNLERVEL